MFYLLKVKSELDHSLKWKYRQNEKFHKTLLTPGNTFNSNSKMQQKESYFFVEYTRSYVNDFLSNEEISVHDYPKCQQHIDSADYQILFLKVHVTK